jgi:hypothetical protein
MAMLMDLHGENPSLTKHFRVNQDLKVGKQLRDFI